jgi:hypothetical protein
MMRLSHLRAGVAGLSLFVAAQPAVAADYFSHIWLDGQLGRVGYHMTASLQVPRSDEPPGCSVSLTSWELRGDLPPGLTAIFSDAKFEGTPRQPGIWNVPVTLRGVGCSNTGQTYGDREINLHFNIDP